MPELGNGTLVQAQFFLKIKWVSTFGVVKNHHLEPNDIEKMKKLVFLVRL